MVYEIFMTIVLILMVSSLILVLITPTTKLDANKDIVLGWVIVLIILATIVEVTRWLM